MMCNKYYKIDNKIYFYKIKKYLKLQILTLLSITLVKFMSLTYFENDIIFGQREYFGKQQKLIFNTRHYCKKSAYMICEHRKGL